MEFDGSPATAGMNSKFQIPSYRYGRRAFTTTQNEPFGKPEMKLNERTIVVELNSAAALCNQVKVIRPRLRQKLGCIYGKPVVRLKPYLYNRSRARVEALVVGFAARNPRPPCGVTKFDRVRLFSHVLPIRLPSHTVVHACEDAQMQSWGQANCSQRFHTSLVGLDAVVSPNGFETQTSKVAWPLGLRYAVGGLTFVAGSADLERSRRGIWARKRCEIQTPRF